MTQNQGILSEEELPFQAITDLQGGQATDANAGASEGYLGQRQSPDAVSGASAIYFLKKEKKVLAKSVTF